MKLDHAYTIEELSKFDSVSFPEFLSNNYGADVADPVFDGRFHSFKVGGSNHRNGRYMGHDMGDYQVAFCMDWANPTENRLWWYSCSTLTDSEKAEIKARIDAKAEADAKTEQDTIEGLREAFSRLHPADPENWYLKKKGVKPYGLLFTDKDGKLVIPMNKDGQLHSCQIVSERDGKRFFQGISTKGCELVIPGSARVFMAEGYATGASIHAATGATVIIAFSAGNLKEIAPKHPDAVIIADNDESGTGEAKAKLAKLPYKLIPEKGMDANDYALKYGLEKLKDFLIPSSSKLVRITPDFFIQKEPEEELIDELVPKKGIGALYGKTGSGKSFTALEMALAVASGQHDWRGHLISRKSKVLYLCAEGFNGFRHRVVLWCQVHGITAADIADTFTILPYAIKVDKPDEMKKFISTLEEEGFSPDFIIIDTGRRCMSGEENSSDDVELFLSACDEIVDHFNAVMAIVLHIAKAASDDSPRGSGVWVDHMDFAFSVTKDEAGIITFKTVKEKDGRTDISHNFVQKEIELNGWIKQNGFPVCSCVLEDASPEVAPYAEALSILKHGDYLVEGWLSKENCVRWMEKLGFKNYKTFIDQRRSSPLIQIEEKGFLERHIESGRETRWKLTCDTCDNPRQEVDAGEQ